MPTHAEDRPTGVLRRRIHRGDWPMRERAALHMTPQMGHRVQLRGGRGQQPQGHVPGLRPPPACRSGRWGTPILKEDQVPAPPRGAHPREEGVLRGVVPGRGDAQAHLTTPEMESARKHAPGMRARDRPRDLLPSSPLTGIPGGSRGADRFVKPQQNRAGPATAAPCAPPVPCRPVGARWASRCRGRFHRTSKRANAKLPLCRETVRSWVSRRYGVRRGAVQTVEREPNARGAWGSPASSNGAMRSCTVGGRPLRTPSARRSLRAAGRRVGQCLTPL